MIKWGRRGHDALLAALLLALSPTLSGCSSDEEAADVPSARIPIHFSATIGGGEENGVTSRATMDGTGTAWAGNELVRIQLDSKGSLPYKVSNTTNYPLTATGTPYYWYPVPASHDYAMKAWSFGNTTDPGTTVPGSFSIATNQSTTNKELLYGYGTIVYGGTPTTTRPITFYHQLAQVKVILKYQEPYSTTNTWSRVKSITYGTTSNGVYASGTFSAPTSGNFGTWSSQTGSAAITPKTLVSTAGAEQYSAVLIPGDYSNRKLIVITLDDFTSGSSTFIYTTPVNTKFEAGKTYTYTLTIDDVRIRFEGATLTINKWGDNDDRPINL